MCITTINQTTIIKDITVALTRLFVSFAYTINDMEEVETHSTDLFPGITEDNMVNMVRLFLIEKYK